MGSRQRRKYANLSKPRTHWDLTVEQPEIGMRLDQFLTKRVTWLSRNEIQNLIAAERITVNDAVRKSSTRMQDRDQVRIRIERPKGLQDPSEIPIEILHEDEQLLVLNKQPGIVVHPVGVHQLDNLLAALHARYRNPDPELDRVPHVCHRIDKFTSGVFLVAFREDWKAYVSLQFERRTVKKQYLALVHGTPSPAEGMIDAPLFFKGGHEPRVIVDPTGLPSQTGYRVERVLGPVSLVRFFPRTGRTHQIRVHSAHIGHPLLCDRGYGGLGPIRRTTFVDGVFTEPDAAEVESIDDADAPLLKRVALHAARLEIVHPGTKEPVVFDAPLRGDIERTIEHLAATQQPTD